MSKIKKIFLSIILIFVVTMGGCKYGNGEIKSVEINEKTMRTYIKGSGDITIIMLSGWNTDSPIDDFMPLADKLSSDYRVVILEYFGYGLSDITMDERSNEAIVQEIRTTLNELNIRPPYVLMPHSMSGLYSLYYANNYPSEVSAIIGIDMSLPQKQLERWTEDTFERANVDEQLSNLNVSVVNQWNTFYNNSKELKDVKYPSYLPVLAFLSTEQIESIDEMIKSGSMKTSWVDINSNMITNLSIQSFKILSGEHYLHHCQLNEIAAISGEFIKNNL